MENLSAQDLKNLIGTAFPRLPGDSQLAILVDLPDNQVPDHPAWRVRRQLVQAWEIGLRQVKTELGLTAIDLFYYPNVHSNNADLPAVGYLNTVSAPDPDLEVITKSGQPIAFTTIFEQYQILLAPTQFSATAPLKIAAKKYGFRAATMPGFSLKMLPALKLDFGEIDRRVHQIKAILDPAEGVELEFRLDGRQSFKLYLDLRGQHAHTSSGLFFESGVAGNLPSGECYIVPYEGAENLPSQSAGLLPVQFGQEVVLYQIVQNRAVTVQTQGEYSAREAEKIQREPAYANLAELGFGILAAWGIQPIGEILLDEKLGLHLAFGRSDHFGGKVGPQDFSSPAAVEHTDRIYLPATQPRIQVHQVTARLPNQLRVPIMASQQYTIFQPSAPVV
ncbi:hypothetical protein L0128_13810 [candidate division KSB1 bacterium]|nr:hypothetical protein [candidate division KSB1 bacterium]